MTPAPRGGAADCEAGCATWLLARAAEHIDASDRARASRTRRTRGRALFLMRRGAGLATAAGMLRDRNAGREPRKP